MGKVKPTVRQKKAFKGMVENGRNKGEALREADYSEAVATHPKRVTESKGWQQLVKEHLSEDKLAKVHDEGLNATMKGKPDFSVRHKYLDTAYKITNKYDNTVKLGFEGVDTEELKERAAELIAGVVGNRSGTKEKGTGESS